jgi:hypothetical protein
MQIADLDSYAELMEAGNKNPGLDVAGTVN